MKLPVCKKLLGPENIIRTDKYCAPVFIASSFFGTLLTEDENLVPEEFNEKSLRNGTMTFISYKNNYYAITCAHVLESLEKRQKKWKDEQLEAGNYSSMEGYELFTPVEKSQYHFNYKLSLVNQDINGNSPDIAIARIKHHSIKRLKRQAIVLTKKNKYPKTGIASGYPEAQRGIRHGKYIGTFSPKFTTCTATLQITGNGELLLQDSIEENHGLNSLSGMSGGPIIWTDKKKFGLAGIVKLGFDIEPQEDGIAQECSIWIHGERITPEIFEQWLEDIPKLKELKDESKQLYVPTGMKK